MLLVGIFLDLDHIKNFFHKKYLINFSYIAYILFIINM
jgi:hypothetical protein